MSSVKTPAPEIRMEADQARFHEVMKTPRHKREGFLFNGETSKAGAKVEFTIRAPRHLVSNEPILVVGGFHGIKPVYGDFRDALAYTLQRPVASFRRPRVEEHWWQSLMPDKILHPAKIGPQAVVALIDLLHERFDGLVTLVGHSMGGPNSVDAALRRPDLVRQVVLKGSGGLEADNDIRKFRERAVPILTDEVLPAVNYLARGNPIETAKIAYESLYYTLRHPWRTGGEMLDVGRRPLMTHELWDLNQAGIAVDAVQSADDRFFPAEIALNDASALVDGMHVIHEANHMATITQAERIAAYVGGVIMSRSDQLAA